MLKATVTKSVRQMLAEADGRPLVSVGVGDALSARLASDADGIDLMLSSGFSISAEQLGLPDVEMYSRTENVLAVEKMCYVSSKPIIADMDTGYGNAINVIKSLHEFERAGVQGVVIEDQVSPKRCPVCVDTTNTLISMKEGVSKIRAAADNRSHRDTLIIARTDAVDFDDAVTRARAYYEAGADLVQPISRLFSTKEDIKRFVDTVGCPVSLVIVGWLEGLSRDQLAWIGPKIVHFALVPVTAMHHAVKAAITELGQAGSPAKLSVERSAHGDIVKDMGMGLIGELEEKYLPQEDEL
ncbi:isocitrate lyase/PEP mutase family protein [Marinobacter sp. F3R08]|uniref:isocitrate lyase/PEP mutase family protein n=1 Tax=Marinobacter sp. F3R08 TaxID=2841559 RepID=UPI001C08B835|nr:isocitrate lyase/PEP mutase family protein [Marinobacter sp. F3R08]MBU2952919.1 isocitrate lyase/PEP mutase family protein [Marinobacter sp. F3R08]